MQKGRRAEDPEWRFEITLRALCSTACYMVASAVWFVKHLVGVQHQEQRADDALPLPVRMRPARVGKVVLVNDPAFSLGQRDVHRNADLEPS
jgi:hypothetical protein